MSQTFAILFYVKGEKINKDGIAPIYLKLTINGAKSEYSLKRRIDPDKWSNGRAEGGGGIAREINKDIEVLQSRLYDIRRDLIEVGTPITAQRIISILKGGEIHNHKTLNDAIRLHNDMVHNLTDVDYAPATLKRYETTAKHIKDYLKIEYNKEDLPLFELNYEFISGFEQYLKLNRKCNHNSSIKYIKNFKTIIHHSIKNDWLIRDPFTNYKCKTVPTVRQSLSQEEIETMIKKSISNERLAMIRDIFVFSCFTGLAHVDITNLTTNDIIEHKGHKLIVLNRTKTGVPSYIYLLPVALRLLKQYEDHPVRDERGTAFPVPSNQKTNAYLKEIADICNIEKNLTFHVARHTFATTISMGNNISTEATGHSLGQKQLRTTQHYAKVEIDKVINEYSKITENYEKV